MADQDPRAYQIAARRDDWGFIGIPSENAVYDALTSLKQSSDAIFEAVLLGFELVNAVLDLISSFLIDITNPIKIIVDAIVSVLNSLVEDLRNAGFILRGMCLSMISLSYSEVILVTRLESSRSYSTRMILQDLNLEVTQKSSR